MDEADALEAMQERQHEAREVEAEDRATPISDSLPACPCGNTLATNDEAGRGTCDECDRLADDENARATDAAEMQLPPGV